MVGEKSRVPGENGTHVYHVAVHLFVHLSIYMPSRVPGDDDLVLCKFKVGHLSIPLLTVEVLLYTVSV